MTLPEFSVLVRLLSGWRADWEQEDPSCRPGIDYYFALRFLELFAGEDE